MEATEQRWEDPVSFSSFQEWYTPFDAVEKALLACTDIGYALRMLHYECNWTDDLRMEYWMLLVDLKRQEMYGSLDRDEHERRCLAFVKNRVVPEPDMQSLFRRYNQSQESD
jgi:hypothetical protein